VSEQSGSEPKRGGGAMKWVLGGCCCLALLGGGGVIAVVALGGFAIVGAIQTYEVEARAFMAEAEAGNIDAAYARFSPSLKQAQSLEAFRQGVQADPDRFAVQSMSLSSINADGNSGVTRVSGTVTSKTGKTRSCEFSYVKEGTALKLVGYQISDQ
jgi:hypothetical protein